MSLGGDGNQPNGDHNDKVLGDSFNAVNSVKGILDSDIESGDMDQGIQGVMSPTLRR